MASQLIGSSFQASDFIVDADAVIVARKLVMLLLLPSDPVRLNPAAFTLLTAHELLLLCKHVRGEIRLGFFLEICICLSRPDYVA